MVWRAKKSKKAIEILFQKFMEEYGNEYCEGLIDEFNNCFIGSVGEIQVYSEFLQLFDEFDIIPKKYNLYEEHFKKLKKVHNLGCNVLEIGSGSIPSFGKKIAAHQLELGVGTVTLYEPDLISKYTGTNGNMTIHKDRFTEDTDTSNIDLITGIMPCGGTDAMISQIDKNSIDFYIAFCGCDHSTCGYDIFGYHPYTPSYHRQIRELQNIVNKNNMGELVIDYLDDRFEVDYPIVYNKRRH